MSKIYVPITGPSESKRAIHKAVELAHPLNLEVTVINVIDKESIAKLQRYKIFIEEESSMFTESMHKNAEKYLNYAKKVGEQYGVRVHTVLLEGDPYSEIYDYIRNDSASPKLVMVGKKTEVDLFKDLFGNIEKKLIMKTDFNIIIAGDNEE